MGEKSEDATPRRLEEAREEGNVPKSQDFAGATMLTVVTLTAWFATMYVLGESKLIMGLALGGDTLGNPIDQGSL
ncbi:MAG: EscU/YscU/HrcU family type III secretion system export apparatus switch protein, partial [Planctomycetota bacterium]|nr:EscU/YscU/HrcU family type III secretion system export apparatus switch protein [Planctomycetota bacterium]